MKYLGNFTISKIVRVRFNTHKADGTPITLAGTPAISVYKNSTTESTTGVTLTVDYDSRTGMHLVAVDTSSDGTFYAAGSDFDIVITTGTVDSISVVGTIVGTFSLENRADVTESYGEPAQGTPAATTSIAAKINYLYKAWRNKKTQTFGQYSLFNDDAATVDHKSTISDDGTTTTIGEISTGP